MTFASPSLRICAAARYMRRFDMCRICFREAALKGELPRSEIELVGDCCLACLLGCPMQHRAG